MTATTIEVEPNEHELLCEVLSEEPMHWKTLPVNGYLKRLTDIQYVCQCQRRDLSLVIDEPEAAVSFTYTISNLRRHVLQDKPLGMGKTWTTLIAVFIGICEECKTGYVIYPDYRPNFKKPEANYEFVPPEGRWLR